jgi:hypothetical protein
LLEQDFEFKEHTNIDGAVYPDICFDIPREIKTELYKKIEEHVGYTIVPRYTFMRRNEKGKTQPYQAHTDLNMAQNTCLIYLQGEGGTSFVEHKEKGFSYNAPEYSDIWARDVNNYDAWKVNDYVDLEPNRAVIYDGGLLHRGEPVDGSGVGEDGRTVLICFFDKGELQRSEDEKAIESVLKTDGVWENISGGKEKDEWSLVISEHPDEHFLYKEGVVFILHPYGSDGDWQLHANVTPAKRDRAMEYTSEALSYGFNQLNACRIVALIAPKYQNVYHFALKMGFTDYGLKDGKCFLTLERQDGMA